MNNKVEQLLASDQSLGVCIEYTKEKTRPVRIFAYRMKKENIRSDVFVMYVGIRKGAEHSR